MAKKTYVAMFEPALESGLGISFPDLPGCTSYGDDLDACMREAHEALTLHLEGMAEDGDAFPDASPLRDLVADTNNPPGVVWASIEVEAPDAAERVNVYLPKSLLDRVDRYVADRSPMNRSTFFTEAARQLLSRGTGLASAEAISRFVVSGISANAERAMDENERSVIHVLDLIRQINEVELGRRPAEKSAADLVGRKAR